MNRSLKNKQQLVRFAAVGGTNTLIDFGLLFLLKSLGMPVITANIISSTIAFVFSFFANKKYTFQSSGDTAREILLFTVVTLFGLWALQSAVIHFSLPVIEAVFHNEDIALGVAKLLATGVSLTWNYILYSLVVFKKN